MAVPQSKINKRVKSPRAIDLALGPGQGLNAQGLIDRLPISVFIFRIAEDGGHICRVANAYFEQLFGFERHMALGLPVGDVIREGDNQVFLDHLNTCIDDDKATSFDWQLQRSPEDLFFRCQLSPLHDADGKIVEVLGTMADRSQEKRAERQIHHNALHDQLTGLPNRVYLQELLDRAIKKTTKTARQCAVLVLNVDRFQLINESLGHVAGDEFLISLTSRLKTYLPNRGMLARFNGDEFGILLENITDLREALEFSDQIHAALCTPISLGTENIYASVSIGVASTQTSSDRAEDIIRDADFAMHRAKSNGKGSTETYRSAVHHHARSMFQLETDLRYALENNALELNYQPIMSIAEQRLVGFEALSRWPHPEKGFVSPLEFIPLAEQTGLIVPLGRWALETACKQLAEWRNELGSRADDIGISVNISGIQFARDDVVGAVRRALNIAHLDGAKLRLEVTESALVENPALAAKILQELKELQVQLALDDFGTGYSSLSYLQRFPFDVLKIDRSFVRDVEQGGENYKLVEILVMLGHRLKMDVVAEGIETTEQAEILKGLGCQFGQGYLFAKPLNIDQAADVIRRSSQQLISA